MAESLSNGVTIVFLRAPEKGKVKTRLAASLGDDPALEFYKGFVLDVLDAAEKVSDIILYCWPPEKKDFVSDWLGHQYRVSSQIKGDIGEKMANAFGDIFDSGYKKAILIGTDIPDISEAIISEAYQRLDQYDTVVGPSQDGGYYLIGFNKETFSKACFKGIHWSTGTVLKETQAIIEKRQMTHYLLPVLNDIDTEDDLFDLNIRSANGIKTGQKTEANLRKTNFKRQKNNHFSLSVIIPALNEATTINKLIESLFSQHCKGNIEVIVVDGDVKGSTHQAIKNSRVIKISSPPGRGVQMNKGADLAKGVFLLFLHADTLLPPDGLDKIISTLNEDRISCGAFDLGINARGIAFRIIEKTASLRSRLTKCPFGDQAIFIKKDFFNEIGRFKEIPIMEDLDLMRRVKKNRGKIKILTPGVSTSPRRWQKEGVLCCTIRNWILQILYLMGGSSEFLAGFYNIGKKR